MSSAREVQDYAVPDGNRQDPFERIVELYYQMKGYITSSNKHFWVFDHSAKKQRGYQDIDVLAVKGGETLIVSVVSNLDDKMGNEAKIEDLKEFFHRAKTYLKRVNEYSWLVEGRVKLVLAYRSPYQKVARMNRARADARSAGILLLSGRDILDYLLMRVQELRNEGLDAKNDLVGLIRLWLKLPPDDSSDDLEGN